MKTLNLASGAAVLHTPTWIELDQHALISNCERVRELAPQADILAMVKANGYGHGADWVAESLKHHVEGFGVARFSEAIALRRQLPTSRIVLLGNLVNTELLLDCALRQLDLLIHDTASAQLLADSSLPRPLRVWLKMNIGMNRLGMNAADFERAHLTISQSENCAELIHMSHFSEAEDRDHTETNRQTARMLELSKRLGEFPRSLANSAAIICHPRSHREWVRPGIMLYGDDPTAMLSGPKTLKPVMTFKSRIIALNELGEGQGVGYNRRWRAASTRLIATIAAGYADGYPRNAPDGTPVLINGQRAPLVGRVSMDLLTVDVSELGEVDIGDEVTLWGQGLDAADIASHCQTISYELFTRITPRVARIYPQNSF